MGICPAEAGHNHLSWFLLHLAAKRPLNAHRLKWKCFQNPVSLVFIFQMIDGTGAVNELSSWLLHSSRPQTECPSGDLPDLLNLLLSPDTLMSGFLPMMPRPEHGRSAMTISACFSQDGSSSSASHTSARILVNPVRRMLSSTSRILFSVKSRTTTCPVPASLSAMCRLFPPGAPHTSRTTSPGFGSAASPTKEELTS